MSEPDQFESYTNAVPAYTSPRQPGHWGKRVLPPSRIRAVPWTAAEIILGLILVVAFWELGVQFALQEIGFFAWVYGPDTGQLDKLMQIRMGLWTKVIAFPFEFLTFPILFYLISGTYPYQLGLTTHRLGKNLLAGVLLAGPLILAVYGVYVGVLWLQALGFPGSPETHPLAVLKGHLTPPEVVVLLLAVLVAAPALEELVARGVILRWCTQRYLGSHLAMLLSLGAALLLRGPGIKEAIQQPDYLGLLRELLPAFFVLVMGWLYGIVLAYSASPVGPAIFSSSLLFAIVHAFAWPSPVPLFVLALGLGWLAQRTQSLVGPILIHSVFNGVGCLVFFLS